MAIGLKIKKIAGTDLVAEEYRRISMSRGEVFAGFGYGDFVTILVGPHLVHNVNPEHLA
ncbi:unnamed protein product, partial [marine sediment metagenome]